MRLGVSVLGFRWLQPRVFSAGFSLICHFQWLSNPPAFSRWWFSLPSAVGGQQLFGSPRANQAVRGHLFDLETMTTISTGAITLISGSERLRTTITDDDGYLFLPIAEPGEYQLEARRMGYATTVSQPIQVTRADTLTVRFGVQVRAVLLEGLDAETIVAVEIYRYPGETPPDLRNHGDMAVSSTRAGAFGAVTYSVLEFYECGVVVYWTTEEW